MSPQQLQRFVVRMSWDPALVERVYAGAPVPGLDAEGRGLLTRVDRRAWDTDPYRRARTLQALIEEYPCSVAEVGVAGLDRFFGAPAFHDAITERRSLALAFGAWLGQGGIPAIELALATVRRAAPTPPPPRGQLVRSAAVRTLELAGGTLARWEALVRELGAEPLPRLLAGLRVPPRATRSDPQEHVLVQIVDGAATASLGSEGVHALLSEAARPVPRADLVRVATKLGATRAEAAEILDELVADGLLVAG